MTGVPMKRGGGKKFDITATTLYGLEEILSAEAAAAGGEDIAKGNRAVSFRGDRKVLYRANLSFRTASRVLVPLRVFEIRSERELYDGAREIDWSGHLDAGGTFAVDSVVHSQRFRHANYAALKVKDAVADQFRDRCGRRPSVDRDDPGIGINVHIDDRECTISLDSSGEPLHRRGYRLEGRGAPLSEVLAAGMVIMTGWDGRSSFVDPMCGSGTIAIEAALIASGTAPGLLRKKFAFMRWSDFDGKLYEEVREELMRGRIPDRGRRGRPAIAGSDISSRSVEAARKNARRAGVGGAVSFLAADFEDMAPPPPPGVLVMNPPYGERMGKEDIKDFYRKIGDTLKRRYEGYDAWMLSSNLEALKYVGLHPSAKKKLFNGPLECRFHKFTVYQGSMKKKREKETGGSP